MQHHIALELPHSFLHWVQLLFKTTNFYFRHSFDQKSDKSDSKSNFDVAHYRKIWTLLSVFVHLYTENRWNDNNQTLWTNGIFCDIMIFIIMSSVAICWIEPNHNKVFHKKLVLPSLFWNCISFCLSKL